MHSGGAASSKPRTGVVAPGATSPIWRRPEAVQGPEPDPPQQILRLSVDSRSVCSLTTRRRQVAAQAAAAIAQPRNAQQSTGDYGETMGRTYRAVRLRSRRSLLAT